MGSHNFKSGRYKVDKTIRGGKEAGANSKVTQRLSKKDRGVNDLTQSTVEALKNALFLVELENDEYEIYFPPRQANTGKKALDKNFDHLEFTISDSKISCGKHRGLKKIAVDEYIGGLIKSEEILPVIVSAEAPNLQKAVDNLYHSSGKAK